VVPDDEYLKAHGHEYGRCDSAEQWNFPLHVHVPKLKQAESQNNYHENKARYPEPDRQNAVRYVHVGHVSSLSSDTVLNQRGQQRGLYGTVPEIFIMDY
jgi:hypothetical protein